MFDSVEVKKTMSISELARSLSVSRQSIMRVIGNNAYLSSTVQVSNGVPAALTEEQCTIIKMFLEGHHNIADKSVVSVVSNDAEFYARSVDLVKYAEKRLAELERQNAEQQQQLAVQAPKVEFFDTVADSKDATQMRNVAAVLNMEGWGRNKIFALLREKQILDEKNIPYRSYQDSGYFRVVESNYIDSFGDTKITYTTLVTQKGVDFIRKIVSRNSELVFKQE